MVEICAPGDIVRTPTGKRGGVVEQLGPTLVRVQILCRLIDSQDPNPPPITIRATYHRADLQRSTL